MTVTYTARVANARFGGFYKLLLLWRGSIYKLLYKEFLAFFATYLGLSLTYRFVLAEDQKRYFEKLVIYCNNYANLIPVSFVLGFMTREERKKYENLSSSYNKYWIPCVWFTNLAAQARKEGRVRDNCALKMLMEELNHFRANCSMLFHYDWISVPLVYTQVSMMAVDEMYDDLPLLEKDRYWDASNPRAPYTAATVFLLHQPSFQGSTFDMTEPPARGSPPSAGYRPWLQNPIEEETTA
ncbi:Bestrophin-2 [Chelonia mydas]|uniref:Bestrophin homolog n=1 Tax=Chelonia mydas TaxID=8469 RepID=M7BJ66_CHEMY|nr:Bestrophin-2 [Chelonia mydas]